jgi:hypothetical protein
MGQYFLDCPVGLFFRGCEMISEKELDEATHGFGDRMRGKNE